MCATMRGHAEVVALLLSYDASNIDAQNCVSARSPMQRFRADFINVP